MNTFKSSTTCFRPTVGTTKTLMVVLSMVAMVWTSDRLKAEEGFFDKDHWHRNGLASPQFVINGTESRSNPLKRKLKRPFDGDELFVRYRMRYDAESIDLPGEDEGEFFVLWLDDRDGGEQDPPREKLEAEEGAEAEPAAEAEAKP